jgi:hypothetical protein
VVTVFKFSMPPPGGHGAQANTTNEKVSIEIMIHDSKVASSFQLPGSGQRQWQWQWHREHAEILLLPSRQN